MAKKTKAKTIESSNGVVKVTNRFFVSLREYGNCDDKGKTVLGIGCSSQKLIAPPDAPLAMMIGIIDEFMPSFRYSTKEACDRDIKRLRDFAENLSSSGSVEEDEGVPEEREERWDAIDAG